MAMGLPPSSHPWLFLPPAPGPAFLQHIHLMCLSSSLKKPPPLPLPHSPGNFSEHFTDPTSPVWFQGFYILSHISQMDDQLLEDKHN